MNSKQIDQALGLANQRFKTEGLGAASAYTTLFDFLTVIKQQKLKEEEAVEKLKNQFDTLATPRWLKFEGNAFVIPKIPMSEIIGTSNAEKVPEDFSDWEITQRHETNNTPTQVENKKTKERYHIQIIQSIVRWVDHETEKTLDTKLDPASEPGATVYRRFLQIVGGVLSRPKPATPNKSGWIRKELSNTDTVIYHHGTETTLRLKSDGSITRQVGNRPEFTTTSTTDGDAANHASNLAIFQGIAAGIAPTPNKNQTVQPETFVWEYGIPQYDPRFQLRKRNGHYMITRNQKAQSPEFCIRDESGVEKVINTHNTDKKTLTAIAELYEGLRVACFALGTGKW